MYFKDLLNNLAAPACRALEANGITNLEQLSSYDEKEIAEWHGISKNAMEVISLAIAEYKSSPKAVLSRFVDAFNRADVEELASLYHEDATNHQVANEPV